MMDFDDSAVAGFFEDLPVLLIILAGVSLLVLSGAEAAQRSAVQDAQAELESLACRFIGSMIVSLNLDHSIEHVSLASVMSLNLTRCACDALDRESWSAAIVLLSPEHRWLRSESVTGSDRPVRTGYSSVLLNVVLDSGAVGVVELMVIVWR
jgi:hypothetical protein